jgi:5-methylcytosine-specific restriction endonuclease McrA
MALKKKKLSPKEKWAKRLNAYFIAFARRVFRWSPPYREVLKRAFVRKDKDGEWFRCENCADIVLRKDKQVDHIDPVVAVYEVWDGSWDWYRARMFVEEDCLRVLCRPCHGEKSKKENADRRAFKKGRTKKNAA